MTEPIDITDPMVVKAFSHPLRIEILGLLDNRVASPKQLAAELGTGLSATSYHVRQLAGLKLIKQVSRRQVRGAVEHYYTATVRPTVTDVGWGQLPEIVKRRYLGGKLAQIGKEVADSASRGGFDREDMHLTRTSLRLTEAQWKQAGRILERALRQIEALGEEGAPNADRDPKADEIDTIAVMMLFEAAPAVPDQPPAKRTDGRAGRNKRVAKG